ncbi:MAG: PAS domain S-box protein, partial [candidate division WOR-3 bacterium]
MKQTRKTRSPQRTKGQKSRRARSDQIQGKRRAESPRRKSKDYYRDLVEHSRDLICTHDLEGRILSVNPLPAKILGYDPKALQQMNIRDILAPEVRHEFEAYLARIQQQGSDAGLMLVQTATGEKRVWEYSNTLRTEGVAKPIVYGMAHDVTERVHAERTLRQSEARYRELADSIADVFFAMDTDLRYTYWNKASEKLTGILAQDAIGKSLYDLFPDTPQTRRAERVYREVLRTQQPQSFINEYQLGGKDYVFEISAYPSKHGLSVFVKDITERRRAEEALRDREEWFREIFEGSRDAIFLIDANMRCVKVNRAAC